MQRRSVDLPEPEGPMMQTTSAFGHRQRNALQHLDLAERLVHVADIDDGCEAGLEVSDTGALNR